MKRQKFYATRKWSILLIAPRKLYLKRLISSLAFLRGTAPDEFEKVASCLNSVLIVPAPGYTGVVSQSGVYIQASGLYDGRFGVNKTIWQASCFVHEAYHVRQFLAGWWERLSNKRAEENATRQQIRYINRLGQHKMVEYLKNQLRKRGGWWDKKSPRVKKELERLERLHDQLIQNKFDIQYVPNKNLR